MPEVAIALFGDGNALLYDQNKIEDKLKKRYGISLPDGKKEGFDSYIKHIELTSEQEKDQNLLNQLKPKYEQLSKLYERNKKNEELDDKLDSSLDNNLNQVTSLVAKYSPEGAGLDMGFSSLGFKDADDDAAAGLTETERVYAKIIQSVDKALPAASGKDKEKLVANKKYIQGSLNREREDVAIQLETEKIVDQVKAITGQSHKTEDDNGNDITYTFSVHENMFSSLEERIKVAGLTKKQLAHPGIASLLSDLKKSEEASHPEINNDTYKKYFKEIYSKRDTVSKASDYEWSRMSDASIEKIARKFKANSI